MGREDLLTDDRFATMASRGEHKAEVDTAVRGWTATRDKLAVMRALGDAGVPAGALRTTNAGYQDMRDGRNVRGVLVM